MHFEVEHAQGIENNEHSMVETGGGYASVQSESGSTRPSGSAPGRRGAAAAAPERVVAGAQRAAAERGPRVVR